MQELWQYPPLDTKYNQLLVNYAIDVYTNAVQPILDQLQKRQSSQGSSILKMDSGYKVCPTGLTTVMGADGMILASYMGTSSYWHLAGSLTALGLRCKNLGKVCDGHAAAHVACICAHMRTCHHLSLIYSKYNSMCTINISS